MKLKNSIRRYLERLGVKDPTTELNAEEKATLENWRKILSEGELTLEKVQEFCEYQITIIENQFRDPSKSDREKANLTLVHSVYSSIRVLILSPKAERESLENYLNSLINS